MKKEHGFFNKKQENAKVEEQDVRKEDSFAEEMPENTEESKVEQTVEDGADVADIKDVEALVKENQRLKDEFLRVLAESENIKKRCASEIEKNSRYAISAFAKDLLSVADNLQRALSVSGKNFPLECEPILKGVELTQNELNHVFSKFGIVAMADVGKIFDPNYHRVVQEVEDATKPSGMIISELQTGYLINGRILREAMVVVTKGGK